MAPNYKNFIYMEEQGFIFAYVPKVACTNWKSLMRYMAGQDDWLDNKRAHDKVNGGLRYLDFDGPDAALLDDPSIRKYAMVRDPYSRILSAYLNKVENRLPVKAEAEGGDHFDMIVRDIDRFRYDVLGEAAFPEISFEVFLRWLKDSGSPYVSDEHWAPQAMLLRQPGVDFDMLGRFETLATDAPRILSAMDCAQPFPSQEDVNFAPTDAHIKNATYYTTELRALVEGFFMQDFKAFDYPHSEVADSAYLRGRGSNFTTVAAPYDTEDFVKSMFNPISAPGPCAGHYRKFMEKNAVMPALIDALATAADDRALLQIVDCGVYMGMFTIGAGLLAAKNGHPTQLRAYEANPLLIEPIQSNLALYGIEAELHNSGVAGKAGKLEFTFAEGRMIGGTLNDPQSKKTGTFQSLQCPVVPLFDILDDSPQPGLVKLDIEGSENDAFHSIRTSENRCRNVFIIEYAPWQGRQSFGETTYIEWLLSQFDIFSLGSWAHAETPVPIPDPAALDAFFTTTKRRHNIDLLLVPRSLPALCASL